MKNSKNLDTTFLDNLIVGRTEPMIYAFETSTLPNYVKVGDTYRAVNERLHEWKRFFPNLKECFRTSAKINNDLFFRDYSVHLFLENKGKIRLTKEIAKLNNVYFSNEFFRDIDNNDIIDAVDDILDSYKNSSNKYKFYNTNTLTATNFTYERTETFELRDNQKEVVDNFNVAVNKKHRKKLLLYAVMRFGKSFTSMCCALENKYKITLIVSAKADVKNEWKKTIESHTKFKNFVFLESKDLLDDEKIIFKTLKSNKQVAIFLTLQDLQGKDIKDKHKELFKHNVDFMIVDETHFGARGKELGRILLSKDEIKGMTHIKDDEDYISYEDVSSTLKIIKPKVTLHLSGTPYRILMSDEFKKEDIIGFYQFSDIYNEQKEWNDNYLLDDNYQEWENPYFGFPQMIRFAFNLNKSSRNLLNELSLKGVSSSLNELLRPQSIKFNKEGKHKLFIHEKEIMDLLTSIDGSQYDDVFSFLNYEKIKKGNMCNHMVWVLPYCASCDALENLLIKNKNDFINLSSYKIINISGIDKPNLYKNSEDVVRTIAENEKAGNKTITLTVNRMLTGSTVKYWDTIVFLKSTSSPQEYDQASFRIQNPYIKIYEDDDKNQIKYNMKPQTLCVDFDPNRMFILQEEKAQIYNANIDLSGNLKLKERLNLELKISPIITIDNDKMVEIKAVDILNAISDYSRNKSVFDEASTIPVDLSLINDKEIFDVIKKQGRIGNIDGLFVSNAYDEGEQNIDNVPDVPIDKPKDENASNEQTKTIEEQNKIFIEKFRTYYLRLLFFAFLTDDRIYSVEQILEISKSKNNKRILKNLDIDLTFLKLLIKKINIFYLRKLDYKIQNINNLAFDETLTKIERATNALNKFQRLSSSEVMTPINIAEQMLKNVKKEEIYNFIENKGLFLDVASKSGEFAIAFYNIFKNDKNIKNIGKVFYSIPTSSYAYEFTRKIYHILDFDINNIASNFNSYDLINAYEKNDKKLNNLFKYNGNFSNYKLDSNGGKKHMFKVIVGNPPYQEETVMKKSTSNGQAPRRNIFQNFQLLADQLSDCYTCLIYPGGRWIHQSGKGLKEFGFNQINDLSLERIDFYPDSSLIFKTTSIPDGISIVFKRKAKQDKGFLYCYHDNQNNSQTYLDNPGNDLIPLNPKNIKIVDSIKNICQKHNFKFMNERICSRSLFGIESNFVESNPDKIRKFNANQGFDSNNEIKVFTNDKAGSAGRGSWYVIDRNAINISDEIIRKFKVAVSSAHPGGQDNRDRQLEIFDNYSVFGRTRVALGLFDTYEEAFNFYQYNNTNLIRFMFLMTKESLSSLGKVVPDIGDYSSNNKLIDFKKPLDIQLYNIFKLSEDEIAYIENTIKNS